jgi:hypothetical protein
MSAWRGFHFVTAIKVLRRIHARTTAGARPFYSYSPNGPSLEYTRVDEPVHADKSKRYLDTTFHKLLIMLRF